jgi:hypothetical protein
MTKLVKYVDGRIKIKTIFRSTEYGSLQAYDFEMTLLKALVTTSLNIRKTLKKPIETNSIVFKTKGT